MKIICLCKKDPCAAIIAAYGHLKINGDAIPNQIKDSHKKEGHFYYLGLDEKLNEVYFLYSSKGNYILENLLKGFAHLYDEEVRIINLENNLKERW